MENLPPEKVALRRAAAILGGQEAMAHVLGLRGKGNVSPWFVLPRAFPAHHCLTIERATRAAGSPVTCEELRPDVSWSVLREPVSQA